MLLVSFLRDFSFWKDGAGRLGLDLEALGRRGRLAYVDGLGGLFYGGGGGGGGGASLPQTQVLAVLAQPEPPLHFFPL